VLIITLLNGGKNNGRNSLFLLANCYRKSRQKNKYTSYLWCRSDMSDLLQYIFRPRPPHKPFFTRFK